MIGFVLSEFKADFLFGSKSGKKFYNMETGAPGNTKAIEALGNTCVMVIDKVVLLSF